MRFPLLILMLLLSACYNPHLPSGSFQCGPNNTCPSGLVCAQDGLCRDPGDTGPDLSVDGATVIPDGGGGTVDMTASEDLSQADMSTGGNPDMTVGPACKGAGFMIDTGFYACSGKFDKGLGYTLCGPGYHVCTRWNSTKDPATACNTDFYALNYSLSLNLNPGNGNIMDEQCGNTNDQTQALVGCGNLATPRLPTACQGVKVQLPCNGSIIGWDCTMGLSDADHTITSGGVLCCQN